MVKKNNYLGLLLVCILFLSFCLLPLVNASESAFGYDTFDITQNWSSSYVMWFKVTVSETAYLFRFRGYFYASTPCDLEIALYDDSGGVPNNLVVVSEAVEISGAGWYNFTVVETEVSAGSYWIATHNDFSVTHYLKSTAGVYDRYRSIGDFPDPAGSTTQYQQYGVCCQGIYTTSPPDQPPEYSDISTDDVRGVGSEVTVSCFWEDDNELDFCYFSTNTSGVYVNYSVSVSGVSSWANYSFVLNYSAQVYVGYLWYCNDSLGQWNNTDVGYIFTLGLDYGSGGSDVYVGGNGLFYAVCLLVGIFSIIMVVLVIKGKV